MRLRLALAAAVAAASYSFPASAQHWLGDPRFSEGIGIRVGNLELHPGIGAEFGYDSNYFQRADSEQDRTQFGEVVDVFRLRVTPQLSLRTLSGPRRGQDPGAKPMLTFAANAYAAYNELWAADSANSDDVGDSNRKVSLGVTAGANIAPGGVIGMDIQGDVQRVGEPSNSPDEEFAWDRWAFHAGAGVSWRPGGGLFEWRAGYDLTYHYFEGDAYSAYDNLRHRFSLKGRWKFLPRTALIYDGNYTLIRYTEDPAPGASLAETAPPNGETVSTRIGVSGLVTYRLALTGMIGWMSSFYDNAPQNQDSITAQAEAKYYLMAPPSFEDTSAATGLSTFQVGYARSMTNSYVNTFYTRDRGYLGITYLLGNVLVTSLEGGFSYLTFPRGREFEAFDQKRIDARLFTEYRFSSTIGLNGTLRYDTNMSEELRPRSTRVASEDLDFTRWQAYIGLRWFM